MICQSRIPPFTKPRTAPNAFGWPADSHTRCGQSVGLATFLDGCGQEWSYCQRPGHREDVQSQADYSDALRLRTLDAMRRPLRDAALAERALHEWTEDQRPPSNDREELMSVRPEMGRFLR